MGLRSVARKVLHRNVLAHGLFWSWNAIFLSVVSFGLLPFCLASILGDVVDERIPLSLFLAALLLLVIPIGSLVLGIVLMRRTPGRLFQLFYGFEAPLMLLALARLFLVRELTAGMGYALLVFGVGATVFFVRLLRDPPARGGWLALSLVGDAVCLVAGIYTAVLVAFYAIPGGWAFGAAFLRFEWWHDLARAMRYTPVAGMFLLLLGMTLFAYSATLLVLLPTALVALYTRHWARGATAFARVHGRVGAAAITVSVACALIAGFVIANQQPQALAFAWLEHLPTSDLERRALIDEAPRIRDGLRAAYVAPYRYALGRDSVHIEELYTEVLGLPRAQASLVQALYDRIALPLIYDGKLDGVEQRRASELYASFFDEPLQKGEKDAVLSALAATWDHDGREAGLLNAGQRKVRVARQEISVDEHGDVAEVELHEVYENQTPEEQELFYSFALPETAVVTGLWLGYSEDRARRFPFAVSPRGAAQAIYRREVQRRVDPALVEEIGPRQYRLRAFPVPPRPGLREGGKPTPPLHLWLTYRVLDAHGAWPLPTLLERRNVYQDARLERLLRGKALPVDDDEDEWLPAEVAALHPEASMPRSHATRIGDYLVRATPQQDPAMAAAQMMQTHLPVAGRAYAVVIDRSRSMASHADELVRSLATLEQRLDGADLDLYLTAAHTRGEPPSRVDDPRRFDARSIVYFGGQNPGDMIAQLATLRGGKAYAAILVLTDAGSLDLASDEQPTHDLRAPLWMIHLGGRIAPGYDDATLATMQRNGGGAATSIERALTELSSAAATGRSFVTEADGYRFTLEDAIASQPSVDGAQFDAFAPIAARQAIHALLRRGDPSATAQLDALHAIARREEIVSEYSSMIVLVDERQRAALKEAEASADRFHRVTETGQEQLTTPSSPFGDVTGTPEPAEWALMLVAGAALLWLARRRAMLRHSPLRS